MPYSATAREPTGASESRAATSLSTGPASTTRRVGTGVTRESPVRSATANDASAFDGTDNGRVISQTLIPGP